MTDRNFQACSLGFIETNDRELYGDEIRIQRTVFESWIMGEFNAGQSMLVRVTNTQTGMWRILCVGAPHVDSTDIVYIPQWIMDNLGIESLNSWVNICPFHDDIPQASLIRLKPMDSAVYYTDIRECFEKALDRFHVLQEGTMLSVLVEALGNYEIQAYVEHLEPGHIVRLGGEVSVEFVEPDGGIPEFVARESEEPAPPSSLIFDPSLQPAAEEKKSLVDAPIDYQSVRDAVRESWLRKIEYDTMKNDAL